MFVEGSNGRHVSWLGTRDDPRRETLPVKRASERANGRTSAQRSTKGTREEVGIGLDELPVVCGSWFAIRAVLAVPAVERFPPDND